LKEKNGIPHAKITGKNNKTRLVNDDEEPKLDQITENRFSLNLDQVSPMPLLNKVIRSSLIKTRNKNQKT
jgi:hypothetical protein